jgi:hypothetical protein
LAKSDTDHIIYWSPDFFGEVQAIKANTFATISYYAPTSRT